MYAALTSGKTGGAGAGGHERPNCKFLSQFCSHGLGPLAEQAFYQRPGAAPDYPWAVGFHSLPTHRIIPTNQPHLPAGTGGTHPDTTEPAPTVPGCSCSQVQPHVALHGVQCHPPPGLTLCD